MKKTIESACNELLATNPASCAVVRALVTLRSIVDHPDLAAGDDDIKLAAEHVEDAIWSLVGALQGDK